MSRNRTLLVLIASGLVASSGWVYAYRAQSTARPFIQSMERVSSRVLYFGNRSIDGQFMIETGQPVWKDEYKARVENSDDIPAGSRFRMGNNFWSTLETTVDLEIGGAAIPVGYYYLCWEKSESGVNLAAFDANEMRAKGIASFQPPQEGGISIPMTLEETDDVTENLEADFVIDNDSGEMHLEIAWGPYVLSAPVKSAPRG